VLASELGATIIRSRAIESDLSLLRANLDQLLSEPRFFDGRLNLGRDGNHTGPQSGYCLLIMLVSS